MSGLLDIPKLYDYRNKIKHHSILTFPVLTVSGKDTIAIHHSLTKQDADGSNAEGYARYHVDRHGWPSIGYSYVIEPDGTIKFCNDIELRTYHVGNHNNYAVGVCLTGDFRSEEPTDEQKESLRNLVEGLQSEYPNLKYIKGHNEFSGYEWKPCPEFDFRAVLNEKGDVGSADSLPGVYTIQEGDTLWSIANGIDDVSVDDLKNANDVDPANLKVGQEIKLGEAKTHKPKPQTKSHEVSGDIAYVQKTLNDRYGLSIAVDNINGPETERALIKGYQTELNQQFNAGLAVDGIWGANTDAASVTVSRGAEGDLTWILQASLRCKGYDLSVDGIFGSGTKSTVKQFQRDAGIKVDGLPGANTFARLL